MKNHRTLICLTALIFTSILQAADPLTFSSETLEARYQQLTQELRCLVCQNQNLADSDAPLAQDLRKEIHQMLESGQSDEEIKTFLVERYGDFVLYRPAVGGNTLALWFLPLILLLLGGAAVALAVKRRAQLPESPDEETSL
jgi:cytochrome c-type biogenesis protein CcmH